MREILKAYMLHVYKWTGNFECDDGGDEILWTKEFLELKNEIINELKEKNLSEHIVPHMKLVYTDDGVKDIKEVQKEQEEKEISEFVTYLYLNEYNGVYVSESCPKLLSDKWSNARFYDKRILNKMKEIFSVKQLAS